MTKAPLQNANRGSRRPTGSSRAFATFGLAWMLCLATSSTALAQRPELELSWEAPPDCSHASSVRGRVAERLGRPLAHDAPHWLSVHAQLTAFDDDDDGYTLALELQDRHGTHRRSLSAQDCGALVEAAALVIALALEPDLATPAQQPDAVAAGGAHSDAASATPDAPEPPAPEPAATAEPIQRTGDAAGRFGVAAAAALDWGSLPSVAPGPAGSLSWTRGRLRTQLSAQWFAAREAAEEAASAKVGLFTVSGSLCVRAAGNALSLWPCLGAEAGRITARGGPELLDREQHHLAWGAALLGLRAAWQAAAWLSFGWTAALAVPFARPRFGVEAPAEAERLLLHRPAPVALRAGFAAELTF